MKTGNHSLITRLIGGIAILLMLITAVSRAATVDDYPRNPDIDIRHYLFQFTLTDESDVITGAALITVQFRTAGVTGFTLDLIGKSGSVNRAGDETGMVVKSIFREEGKISLKYEHADDRLQIHLSEPSKADESRVFQVNYTGIPADGLIISQNKYEERTFFGDNWPNRARHWLPSIDHPYDKASCEFIVIAPDAYQVVANGRLIEETDLEESTRLTHWFEDAPLPTKVMVIGVARFAVQYLPMSGDVPIQTWVYPQDRDGGFSSFAIAGQVMEYFEEVIGPFSYEKLANVQSRTRYGGMENAGAIFYNEGRGDPVRWGESLIVHEMAHQWFGDSASEADWHHIWLSEGFATYFTTVYMEHFYGVDRFRQRMTDSRQSVLSYYYGDPDNPRQAPHTDSPLVDTTLPTSNRLLSTNSYQKGAWILHMLRHELGDEVWWTGIREYYRRYQDETALTRDFRVVMEEASGKDLERFFQQWVFRPGQPDIHGSWIFDSEKNQIFIILDQKQENGDIFHVPIEFGVIKEEGGQPIIHTFLMDGQSEIFTIPCDTRPTSVILDPDVWLLARIEFVER